ncbi:MAG: DUF2116 family Zn-ribbon domain-containing protein [Candidatus Thermoplasmatota archaeon]|jgi:predicted nucleic acid-binding Zn ribbon protein|nr:DUF2116 family Zn-ribbon domain-containing protein [Candidatus Thermoplasmatota archaeon]
MPNRKKRAIDDILKDESAIIKDMVEKKRGKKTHKKDKEKEKGTRIIQHKHCIVCFKAIGLGRDYCTDECKEIHVAKIKRQKRMMYIMYGVLAVVFVLVVLTSSK